MKQKAKTPRVPGSREIVSFRRAVWAHYRADGRHELPWRKTVDPYRILVSEMMLQQTQVSRVIGKYKEFLRKFPTVRSLARAKLSDVLKLWSGLGYNRRAKYLHECAKRVVAEHKGELRKALDRPLPGVGPYTRAAVRIFAFNEPLVCIETNIRAAFIHHFHSSFLQKARIPDAELLPLTEAAAKRQDPRQWHWALMDYGAHIKKLHDNPTRKSASYGMQSKFEGSLRQVRGQILKVLSSGIGESSYGDLALAKKLAHDERRVREALRGLMRDGLVVSEKGSWRIA